MKLLTLPQDWQGESAVFLEGAVLASNLAVKPLSPESWCLDVGVESAEVTALLVPHINQQHNLLQRSEYSIGDLDEEALLAFSQGFLTVWPSIEPQYYDVNLNDGALRMLQALLTTFMLVIDEQQTQSEMKSAGIEQPPSLGDMVPQLDSMIMEVALAADEVNGGGKVQSVNPYKDVGRNDSCPCGSGKKFKQCCTK